LELLPLLGWSLVVPAPPWFLLQPTSAKAVQTMRINLFIAVVFFNLVSLVPERFIQFRGTIRQKPLAGNTVKPCLSGGKEPRSPHPRPHELHIRESQNNARYDDFQRFVIFVTANLTSIHKFGHCFRAAIGWAPALAAAASETAHREG